MKTEDVDESVAQKVHEGRILDGPGKAEMSSAISGAFGPSHEGTADDS